MSDVVVVGAGLSGLVSALKVARSGASVTLITKGIGGIQLGQGTIDILGYAPERVTAPLDELSRWASANPEHPYAVLSADRVVASINFLTSEVPELFTGPVEQNHLLATPVGAIRPTALIQKTMAAGECVAGAQFVFVGLRQLKDFWPELIAGNIARTPVGGGTISARAAWLDLPARTGEVDSSPLSYARALDDTEYRKRFISELRKVVRPGESVGLPGILGVNNPGVHQEIQDELGQPVFEISTIPPSVPGMRLNEALTRLVKAARVRFVLGSAITGKVVEGERVVALEAGTAGRTTTYRGDNFVFAPGGFESGALEVDSYLNITEPALGLPLVKPVGEPTVYDAFADQPVFSAGVRVDSKMRVLGDGGEPLFANLYAAGGILAGAQRWKEKSGDGIALASAVTAANEIIGGN